MCEIILSLLIPESLAGYFKENVIEGRLLRINAAEAHLIFLQYFQYLNKIVPSPCTACNELVVGIGCTGGKHRSVTIAMQLNDHFREKGYRCVIQHRDIDR